MATRRVTLKDWARNSRIRWAKQFGFTQGLYTDNDNVDYACDNSFVERAQKADGTGDVDVWKVDSDDMLQIGGEAVTPMWATINFPLATNASIVTQQFFIAPYAMEIKDIKCVFATANGAALTGVVTHETGTQAPGTGLTVMTNTFNLNATANTVQSATLAAKYPSGTQSQVFQSVKLAAGDRLSFKLSTTVTSLAGLVITIAASPGGKSIMIPYVMNANGDLVDQTFFVANRDFIVTGAYYVHSTKGTNGSAVNVQVVKDTSTDAPGAGTDLLTNNTNAGFDCKGAINTVQTGTLTATAASLRLAPGDRLSVDFAGTLTALAGVVIIVTLQAMQARKEITFTLEKNANQGVDQSFFIARRAYEILAISEVHATAAGGVSKIQVTRDTATDAPGAGTDLLSNNTNAGFDLNATANTVQLGTFKDTRYNFLLPGDRLSVDYANAAQSSAGVTVTVTLRPA